MGTGKNWCPQHAALIETSVMFRSLVWVKCDLRGSANSAYCSRSQSILDKHNAALRICNLPSVFPSGSCWNYWNTSTQYFAEADRWFKIWVSTWFSSLIKNTLNLTENISLSDSLSIACFCLLLNKCSSRFIFILFFAEVLLSESVFLQLTKMCVVFLFC